MKRTALKRQSKTPIAKLQRLCDALYHQAGKLVCPLSEVSGKPTEVIHHFFTKQSSSNLRYSLDNGVGLTHGEHFSHHIKSDPTIHARVMSYRGEAWYKSLLAQKHLQIQTNRPYYEGVKKSLEILIEELTTANNS